MSVNFGNSLNNQIQQLYGSTQVKNTIATNELSASPSTPPSKGADRVSISEDAYNKLADESRFTLNTDATVYDLGGLSIAVPGELPSVDGWTTRLEAALMSSDLEFYRDAAKDPQAMMEKSKADYDLFLVKSDTVILKLENINRAGSLDFSVNGRGVVSFSNKENTAYNVDQHLSEVEDVKQWLRDNKDITEELSQLSSRYSISKSMNDYEAATGISRQDLADNSLKPMATEGHFKSSDAELNEYAFRMLAYADGAFGTKPVSYSEIDQQGGFGYSKYSNLKYETKLPNMS